jgi:hypothetical protein
MPCMRKRPLGERVEYRDDLAKVLLAGLTEAERRDIDVAILRTHREQLYRRQQAERSRRDCHPGRASVIRAEEGAK